MIVLPLVLASVGVTAVFGVVERFVGYSKFRARHEQAYREHRKDMEEYSKLWQSIPTQELSKEEMERYLEYLERAQSAKEAHLNLLHQDWTVFEKLFRRKILREKKRAARKAIDELSDHVTQLWDRTPRADSSVH
ncbi:hypothetical protein BDP27DRAFT_1321138 [Rhodocollybia butyracea]|uniref:Uncharacterized protein n=1 Tax=Rhodocollybia butyracea TaxID=206335 RepID=A0A9P5UAL1_9AGAR|nr:hypothetical protein BDP27DRAFT_1325731 [Rhodocollybia butyracea]KAF9072124.1 hypothetical protein BDP27DRAFT_1321138 [Rhodocollybia butyracea]